MKYYYGSNEGIVLYPETWWDSFRLVLIKLLLPSFKFTWELRIFKHFNRRRFTIERKLEKTNYPNESSC